MKKPPGRTAPGKNRAAPPPLRDRAGDGSLGPPLPPPMAKGGKVGAHPGFGALVAKGAPAGALANAARGASKSAVKKNPRLLNVPRGKKG